MWGYDLSDVTPVADDSGGGGGGGLSPAQVATIADGRVNALAPGIADTQVAAALVDYVQSDDYDHLDEVTAAEYDALDPADPRTLYTLVG